MNSQLLHQFTSRRRKPQQHRSSACFQWGIALVRDLNNGNGHGSRWRPWKQIDLPPTSISMLALPSFSRTPIPCLLQTSLLRRWTHTQLTSRGPPCQSVLFVEEDLMHSYPCAIPLDKFYRCLSLHTAVVTVYVVVRGHQTFSSIGSIVCNGIPSLKMAHIWRWRPFVL